MNFNTQTRNVLLIMACCATQFCLAATSQAQEKQDPTAASDVIQKTLSKIRDVERLDTFVQQNKALVEENKKLKADIASINKQIAVFFMIRSRWSIR